MTAVLVAAVRELAGDAPAARTVLKAAVSFPEPVSEPVSVCRHPADQVDGSFCHACGMDDVYLWAGKNKTSLAVTPQGSYGRFYCGMFKRPPKGLPGVLFRFYFPRCQDSKVSRPGGVAIQRARIAPLYAGPGGLFRSPFPQGGMLLGMVAGFWYCCGGRLLSHGVFVGHLLVDTEGPGPESRPFPFGKLVVAYVSCNLYICCMTIKHVSVTDARNNFSELIGRAQYGDEPTVISFHDKPVAILVPFVPGSEINKALALKLTVDNINHIRERYGSPAGTAEVDASTGESPAEQAEPVATETEAIRITGHGYAISSEMLGELKQLAAKVLTASAENISDIPNAKLTFDALVKDEYPSYEPFANGVWKDAVRRHKLGLE